ncbi:hypothetical protein JTE90_015777 [Oedothorax gibbosus]|uniref:Uncharacterized protein n=1 Tax=Oedothorax gibbosus TaxID=931172 RepID=A0AAV6VWD2_9ARAC|nr:hypothetical protein JTE90_015777 [Oedothorax gibbosus]
MLRQRLVRQGAMNISSGSDSTMSSPTPVRKRRSSQDSKMYTQVSSESMDSLIGGLPASKSVDGKPRYGRRHSMAASVLYVDIQKPSLKSALNSALKKVSSACSVLSSAQSSTFNLNPPKNKDQVEEDVIILPHVLATFQKAYMPPIPPNCTLQTTKFQVNRRFSTDCPPPSYMEAWNIPSVGTRQKLARQQEVVVSSRGSSTDDEAVVHMEDRLVQ